MAFDSPGGWKVRWLAENAVYPPAGVAGRILEGFTKLALRNMKKGRTPVERLAPLRALANYFLRLSVSDL